MSSSWFNSIKGDIAYWEISENIPGFNWLYLLVQLSMQALSYKVDECWKLSDNYLSDWCIYTVPTYHTVSKTCIQFLCQEKSMNMWTDSYSCQVHKITYAGDYVTLWNITNIIAQTNWWLFCCKTILSQHYTFSHKPTSALLALSHISPCCLFLLPRLSQGP